MRATLLTLVVLVGVVGGSALLAPPITQALLDAGWLEAATDADTTHQFLRVLRRCLTGLGLIALFAIGRPWRAGSLASYGLDGAGWRRARVGRAALLTLVGGLLLLGVHVLEGRLFAEDPMRWGKIAKRTLSWGGRAILIAALEELLFRGWLWRVLAGRWGTWPGACLMSTIFAVVHAFRPSNLGKVTFPVDTAGAFEALGAWAALALDPARFLPAAGGLFLLSMLLCLAWRRTGSLHTAVAIHAMGIAVVYVHPALTERQPKITWTGSGALYDGPPGWCLMGIACLVLWWGGRRDADAGSPRPPFPRSPSDATPS